MTCGKKHCQNAPTEATKVDPAEVEGRPACNRPGCDKRLVGDGTRCADGHVQRQSLVLTTGEMIDLDWAVRAEPPYQGTHLVTLCPLCGAQMVARPEPNRSLGIGLECTAQPSHSRHVGYEMLANFAALLGHRFVEPGQIDFDAVRYNTEMGNEYRLIGGQLYCLWADKDGWLFEPVALEPAGDPPSPVEWLTDTQFQQYDPCGKPCEEALDAYTGPFYLMSAVVQPSLSREQWDQVADLFITVEGSHGGRLLLTMQPEEVASRLLDAGVWAAPTAESLAATVRRRAVEAAESAHRRRLHESYRAYLTRKQAEFEAWQERELAGLERTTAFPPTGEAGEAEQQIHWPKGIAGTWHTTGNTYFRLNHPAEGTYWTCYYGNAAVAYAAPAQAQRWRMREWERMVADRGEAAAAWDVLYRHTAYGDDVFGSDVTTAIVETVGIERLTQLARQQVVRITAPDDGTRPLSDVRIAQQYGVEVREMEAVANQPAEDGRLQVLRKVGVGSLWRDPVDGRLWGRTTYSQPWVEAIPLLEQITQTETVLGTELDRGLTPANITAALRALAGYPQIKPGLQNREALPPLQAATGCQHPLPLLAKLPEDSTLAGSVSYADGSTLEVWSVPPSLRDQHPHAHVILRDPQPQSAANWVLGPRQGDLPAKRVRGAVFLPRSSAGQLSARVYDAAVSGPMLQQQIVPHMAPGDRVTWSEPTVLPAATHQYCLECTPQGLRLSSPENVDVELTAAQAQEFLLRYAHQPLQVAVNAEFVERSASSTK